MGIRDFDFSNIEEAGAIRQEVLRQYRRGRMNILHVIGLPGTGKSWACLRLGELIAEDIHGDKTMMNIDSVVDNLLDLLKFIRRVKKPGEILVAEEIGVWLSSKRAMSTDNVDAGKVWDTLRKKRVIVLANNPLNKDVDKKLLALSSMQIQTLSLNKREGKTIVKPLRLQTNPDTAKTYRHRLHSNGFEIQRCWIGRPRKELTDAYEESKDNFLNELYQTLMEKHQKRVEKQALKLNQNTLTVTPAETRRAKMRERGMTLKEIAKIEGSTIQAISMMLSKYDAKMSKYAENNLLKA